MSMRIVPASGHANTFTHTSRSTSAPSAPGLHDTLRHGIGSSPLTSLTSPSPSSSSSGTEVPTSHHPLEQRLKSWEATQEAARMESLRKTFGMAEPIRRGMELKITRGGEWRPLALGGNGGAAGVVGGGAGLHEDILRGRDAYVDWEDIFTGEEQKAAVGVHEEMERKLKI